MQIESVKGLAINLQAEVLMPVMTVVDNDPVAVIVGIVGLARWRASRSSIAAPRPTCEKNGRADAARMGPPTKRPKEFNPAPKAVVDPACSRCDGFSPLCVALVLNAFGMLAGLPRGADNMEFSRRTGVLTFGRSMRLLPQLQARRFL